MSIEIICRKYSWTNLQGYGNYYRNFFQTDSDYFPTYESQIDLYDYLVMDSLSDIEYTFDEFSFELDKIVKESSSVSLKLNNLKEVPTGVNLSTWFSIYSDNKQFYKYTITIKYNGTIKYFGVLYNEGIKFNNRIKEVIDIDVKGFESEFKDYYSNKRLSEITYFALSPSGIITTRDFKFAYLSEVLDKNIQSNWFWYGWYFDVANYDNAQDYYMVSKIGYMFAPAAFGYWNKGSLYFPCGYDDFYNQGVNFFTYFDSLCNSMGWVWYFDFVVSGTEARPRLRIKKRSQIYASSLSLNFSKSMGHSINSANMDIKADVIMMGGGGVTFDDEVFPYNLENLAKILITRDKTFTNYFSPFEPQGFTFFDSGVKFYSFNTYENYRITTLITDELISFKIGKSSTEFDYLDFDRNNILEIPLIENNSYKTRINTSDVRNNDAGYWNGITNANALGTSGTDMLYWGNPGGMILIKKMYGAIISYVTYPEYIHTTNFRENFYKYLRGKEAFILEVDVNQLITDPAQSIYITGYDSDNATNNLLVNNKYYSILSLSYNLKTETSKLKLQRL